MSPNSYACVVAAQKKPEAILRLLAQDYPLIFNQEQPFPLSLEARRELVKRRPQGIAAKYVRAALAFWVSTTAYRAALAVPGSLVYDLRGDVVEPVPDAKRKRAREMLEGRP